MRNLVRRKTLETAFVSGEHKGAVTRKEESRGGGEGWRKGRGRGGAA